jgi:alpha-tubulin suppressor-like RCC1 family protein
MPANLTTVSVRYVLKLKASSPGGLLVIAKVRVTVEHNGEGVQVATGSDRGSCGVLRSGRVRCWGNAGDGIQGNAGAKSTATPVEVGGITNATQITAGFFVRCALLSTGHIDCWGLLGSGEKVQETPVEVPGISNAIQVAGTCALLSTGHVECGAETPVEVQGISNAVQVASAGRYTCAVLASGHIECWGNNEDGQLGNGTTTNSTVPVEVLGVTDAIQVSAGESLAHACAVLATGSVECWGTNRSGDLGNGTEASSTVPVEVLGLTDAIEVSASDVGSTCAVRSSGQIDCWGSAGLLAHGGDSANSSVPVEVEGLLAPATQVSIGDGTACTVLVNGLMECWGQGDAGALGNGKAPRLSIKPVEVLGM